MSRRILGEPVVFFRKEDGSVVALGNTCPHRLAPLHLGTLRADDIECPYHGLRFGETGVCTLNPHSGTISRSLKVPAYTAIERHRTIWVWMGDPEAADPALIPECGYHDAPGFRTIFDYIPIAAHYELVTDNLLDLTHTRFLHKSFQPPNAETYEFELSEDGQTVISDYNMRNGDKSDMLAMMWPEGPARVDTCTTMRWNAPANLVMRNYNTRAGGLEEEGIIAYTSHFVTPETETSSHYFLGYSRNWRLDDDAFDQTLLQGLDYAVRTEDSPMIELIQREMGPTGDLMSFRPVILPTDTAAIRARLVVSQMLKAEKASSTATNPL